MKLKTLKIKNYRSIRNTELNLSNRINIVIGPSDSGKSNIIRAIRDLCFNNTGTGFVTCDAKISEVQYNDITWRKGKGVNKYRFNKGILKNVGSKSPQEIRDALKIDEIYWDKTNCKKINFMEQLEPNFFLNYSDNLNAKIIGKISGIERIYHGNKRVLDKKREASTRRKYVKEELDKNKEELLKYDFLDEMGKQINDIKSVIDQIVEIEMKINQMQQAYDSYLETRNEYIKYKNRSFDVEIDDTLIKELEDVIRQSNEMESLYEEIKQSKKDVNYYEEIVSGLQDSDKKLINEFNSLLEKSDACPLTKVKFYPNCKKDILKQC